MTIFFFSLTQMSFAANIFIPSLELTSKLYPSSIVQTRVAFQLMLEGGYKYGGKLFLASYNTDLERSIVPVITFDGAQVTVRDIFNVIDFTYWTGYYDILGEGKHYKGYLYHWDENGFDYNGYRPILGTGFIVGAHYYDILEGKIFVYRRMGTVYFNSIDLTFNVDIDPIIGRVFLGLSDDDEEVGPNPIFRFGLQFIYFGDSTESYITIGVPDYAIGDLIGFDKFYLLVEQWFMFSNFNIILSIFSRPDVHYNFLSRDYISTGEINDIDFNLDLNYEPEAQFFSLGAAVNVQTNSFEPFGLFVSPYINIFTSGLAWKIKMDINIISQRAEVVTGFVSASISF